MREKINFDKGWLFHKGDIKNTYPAYKSFSYLSAKTERKHIGPACMYYNDESDCTNNNVLFTSDKWERIDLPHDYIVGGIPDEQYNNSMGFFKAENGWYRKKFKLEESDKGRRIVLHFEGVCNHATVYLNSCLMKHSFTGYTPFDVDITDMVRFGAENVLAVYVNTEEPEGWWYEGGGIYRHVWLIKTDLVSIDRYGIYAKPIKKEESWVVETEVTLRNDSVEDSVAKVEGRILDANGNEVATAKGAASVLCKDKAVVKYCFEVKEPHLWSPDYGYLYTMEARIFVGGKEVDADRVSFGFRTVRIDPNKGLFINEKHYKIKGFCGHGDCGLMGKAVPDNIHRYKVRLMCEMGANGYRTSHYPQSDALMDELDKAGFIVMDEIRWFESTEEGIDQLETLVRRDRNHPSVIFWSVGNEEIYHCREQGRNICQTLMAKLRKLDDSRFVMTAVDRPNGATVYDVNDVIGINYNLLSYDHAHEKFPDKGIFASECAAASTTRGWYFPDDKSKGYISAYDHDANDYFLGREKTWKYLDSREWILGGYQWIGFEHRGEAAWPRLCSQSGAVDLYLQKKDAFYQNMSHYSAKPMVHLLPHWNWAGFEGETISVWAYTNCQEVELFLNGSSLGKRTVEKHTHVEWQVEYAPGVLEVKAYNEGKLAAEDMKVTSDKPYKLALVQDTLDVSANDQDIAVVTCLVLDEKGNEVYDAEDLVVDFTTSGDCRVYSTGSDVSDHNSLFDTCRRMRAGRISVAVKLGSDPRGMKLYARCNGLISAILDIKTK